MTTATDHACPGAIHRLPHAPDKAPANSPAPTGTGMAGGGRAAGRTLLAAALALLVLGCAQEPPPSLAPALEPSQPAVADAGRAGEVAPAPEALPADAVSVDPLPDCSGNQVTTVRWNESALASGGIRIWIEGEPRGLFAEPGLPGEKQTGPWAAPGMSFVVTDAGGRELSRIPVTSWVACD